MWGGSVKGKQVPGHSGGEERKPASEGHTCWLSKCPPRPHYPGARPLTQVLMKRLPLVSPVTDRLSETAQFCLPPDTAIFPAQSES